MIKKLLLALQVLCLAGCQTASKNLAKTEAIELARIEASKLKQDCSVLDTQESKRGWLVVFACRGTGGFLYIFVDAKDRKAVIQPSL